MPRFGPIRRDDLVRYPRQLDFKDPIQAENISS